MSQTESASENPELTKSIRKFGVFLFLGTFAFAGLVAFITWKRMPNFTHQYIQPKMGALPYFVQITYQDQPIKDLRHIAVFLKKPEQYITGTGKHLTALAPNGYSVTPRVIHHDGVELTRSIEKELRVRAVIPRGQQVKIWLVHRGKAFPIINVTNEQLSDWEKLENFASSKLWQEKLLPDIQKFEKKISAGEIDFTPSHTRSNLTL